MPTSRASSRCARTQTGDRAGGFLPTPIGGMGATSADQSSISPVVVDVAQHPNGPWVARLPKGEIELLAVSRHPSAGQPWWRPDGSPCPEGPFENQGSKLDPNCEGYECVIRSRGLEDPALPEWGFDDAGSVHMSGISPTPAQLAKDYTLVCVTDFAQEGQIGGPSHRCGRRSLEDHQHLAYQQS